MRKEEITTRKDPVLKKGDGVNCCQFCNYFEQIEWSGPPVCLVTQHDLAGKGDKICEHYNPRDYYNRQKDLD